MTKPTTYWCPFFRGRPHITMFNDDYGDVGKAAILFRNKKCAQLEHKDVREVMIVEVKK